MEMNVMHYMGLLEDASDVDFFGISVISINGNFAFFFNETKKDPTLGSFQFAESKKFISSVKKQCS
jgi:hypothetical protein